VHLIPPFIAILFSLVSFSIVFNYKPAVLGESQLYSPISKDQSIISSNFPTPTSIPTFLPTPTPTPVPTIVPTPPPISKEDYLLKEVNNFRTSKGLPSVSNDAKTCSFAKLRAKELTTGFNHDGFRNRVDNYQLPYPNYSNVVENIAMNKNYKGVISQWINSPGHAEKMLKDTPFVCIGIEGNFYAYEGWKP